MSSCYLCGEPADPPDDHVPPRVLFRGAVRSYDSPGIITVPSCGNHNQGASRDDEVLAWVLSDAGSLTSGAAIDVNQVLMSAVNQRVWKDPGFADERLAHTGTCLLRHPDDFDENGSPKKKKYDAECVQKSERHLRNEWSVLRRSLQKVTAGLYFHATGGQSLGEASTGQLEIVVPGFKQIGATISLYGIEIDEDEYFVGKGIRMPWRPIESGSREVFQCEISWQPGARCFAMRMCFYNSVLVWVT